MNIELSSLVGTLVALSVASERLVEIIKGMVPALSTPSTDPIQEARRVMKLNVLAVVSGIITAALALPVLEGIKDLPVFGKSWPSILATVIAYGLLASGGSGFWNAVLGYVTQIKNIKKAEASAKQLAVTQLRANQTLPAGVRFTS